MSVCRFALLCVALLLLLGAAPAAAYFGGSLASVDKEAYVRGERYAFTIYMEATYANGSTTIRRSHFYPQVDRLAKLTVTGSAAALGDAERVDVLFMVGNALSADGNGVFGGYVVSRPERVSKRVWFAEQRHVPFWEFLIYADCLDNEAITTPCGGILAAAVSDDLGADATCPAGCDCSIETGVRRRCFKGGELRDLQVVVAWQGTDAAGNSLTSRRQFISEYARFSLGDASQAINQIGNSTSFLVF